MPRQGPRIMLVHGFGYDPKGKGDVNPRVKFLPSFQKALGREDIELFPWYSVPQNAKGFASTYFKFPPNLHRYRYAWELSTAAADMLAMIIGADDGPIWLVGHSLGCRVICAAMDVLPPDRIARVLLLNGAEHQRDARLTAMATKAKVTNICVRDDDVLKRLGSKFTPGDGVCIGYAGLGGRIKAPNWNDIFLDGLNRDIARYRRGWELEGDDPRSYADHWFSYRFEGNWPLYQAWASGDELLDLQPGWHSPA